MMVQPAAGAQPPIPPAPSIPPDATEQDIKVVGKSVLGPGNVKFGTTSGPGLFNNGVTSIADFFKQDPQAFPDTPASLQRVIQSVSENEGHIEAINTYDNSFLSCGIFQWTAGAGAGAGELPGLLDLVRMRSAATFAAYFGSVGLDVAMNAAPAGALRTGFFVLNGQKLNSATLKAQLRGNLWAYRFWRAAHDPQLRRAQVALAMSRVDADESAILVAYLAARLTAGRKSKMTDSQGRADKIKAHVTQGALSAKRGSFVLAS
jgi:hypothetical protein